MTEHDRRASIFFGVAGLGFLAILLLAINSTDRGGGVTDLNGTSWTVEAIVVDGVESSPSEGTTLTAAFADGELTGSAGCNDYFGSFETEGDTLTFGPLGSTRKLCPDPPGADAQEATYLAVLRTSEQFAVDGDRLAIDSFDGGQIIYVGG